MWRQSDNLFTIRGEKKAETTKIRRKKFEQSKKTRGEKEGVKTIVDDISATFHGADSDFGDRGARARTIMQLNQAF